MKIDIIKLAREFGATLLSKFQITPGGNNIEVYTGATFHSIGNLELFSEAYRKRYPLTETGDEHIESLPEGYLLKGRELKMNKPVFLGMGNSEYSKDLYYPVYVTAPKDSILAKRLSSQIVMVFSHDDYPSYSQGYTDNENVEPVTAEHCEAYIRLIKKLEDRVKELETQLVKT